MDFFNVSPTENNLPLLFKSQRSEESLIIMKDFEHPFHSDSKRIGADFVRKYLAFVIILVNKPFVTNNHHIPLD